MTELMKESQLEALGLRSRNQRLQCLRRDAQSSPGKAVDISRVHAYYFSLRVEDRTAAGPVRSGRVVDQFVTNNVAKMSAGRGRPNQ